MITSAQCLKKFGDPNLITTQASCMETWVVPKDIQEGFTHVRFSAVGTLGFPKKIFVNKLMKVMLERALRNLINRGLNDEMTTWDGCFIIRQKRGLTSLSLHSWGLAIDLNAAQNPLGKKPVLSKEFVKCFTDEGFEWGGSWQRSDGMHFEMGGFLV